MASKGQRTRPGILQDRSSLRSFPPERIDLDLWVSGNSFVSAPCLPYDVPKPGWAPSVEYAIMVGEEAEKRSHHDRHHRWGSNPGHYHRGDGGRRVPGLGNDGRLRPGSGHPGDDHQSTPSARIVHYR